jgi:hypothetical protein
MDLLSTTAVVTSGFENQIKLITSTEDLGESKSALDLLQAVIIRDCESDRGIRTERKETPQPPVTSR